MDPKTNKLSLFLNNRFLSFVEFELEKKFANEWNTFSEEEKKDLIDLYFMMKFGNTPEYNKEFIDNQFNK